MDGQETCNSAQNRLRTLRSRRIHPVPGVESCRGAMRIRDRGPRRRTAILTAARPSDVAYSVAPARRVGVVYQRHESALERGDNGRRIGADRAHLDRVEPCVLLGVHADIRPKGLVDHNET